MLGAAASRPRTTEQLSAFVHRTRIPFFTTQMGKGTVAGGVDPLFAQVRKANSSRKVSSGASSCSVCPQSSARPRTSSAFSRQVSSTS